MSKFTCNLKPDQMGNQYNFLQAGLDETIYRMPDTAKVTISQNKINSETEASTSNGTMIIYRPKSGEELSTEMKDTINKLILAIKLQPDDTIRLNFNKVNQIHFQQLTKNHSIKYLICFGIHPKDIGLNIVYTKYDPVSILHLQLIFADAVEDLDKTRLWKKLQQMYQLKN